MIFVILKFPVSVSEEQIKQWHEAFVIDCPNGLLTEQNFIKIYIQFCPIGDPKKFAELVFRVFDENQDGSIEFEVFIRAFSSTIGYCGFPDLDTNCNGELCGPWPPPGLCNVNPYFHPDCITFF